MTTPQNIISITPLCMIGYEKSYFSPPHLFSSKIYWYNTASLSIRMNTETKRAKEILMFIFTQICVTIKWKGKKTVRKKINIYNKKVQIFHLPVFMCQSVSNGFSLNWNINTKCQLICTLVQKGSALHANGNASISFEAKLSGTNINHRPLSTKRWWWLR